MKEILVPTAPGELIDKLTILRLKSEKITDPVKLTNVRHELSVLRVTADAAIEMSPALRALWDDLYRINADLWAVEDDIRACEARSDFGVAFIALARAVYVINDDRARVKKDINTLLGSAIVEERSYTDFGDPK